MGTLASLGTLAVIVFTWLSLQQVDDEHALTREGQVTDRYNAAVGNIGDDSLDVRLGGIYALQRIMEDSPRDQPSIVNVLSTYIRSHAKKPKQGTAASTFRPASDVQPALTALGSRDRDHDGTVRIDLGGVHLLGADLTGADLSDAHLSDADLTDTELSGANLFDTLTSAPRSPWPADLDGVRATVALHQVPDRVLELAVSERVQLRQPVAQCVRLGLLPLGALRSLLPPAQTAQQQEEERDEKDPPVGDQPVDHRDREADGRQCGDPYDQ